MKTMTAIVVALSLVASVSQADARQYRSHRHHHHHHYTKWASPQVRGFLSRPGGHRMGYEADPFLYKNGGYGNTPFHDPRNFWERVQSGGFDESTSPGAF